MVSGDYRPLILQPDHLPGPHIDHGLHSQCHPGDQLHPLFLLPEIRDLRSQYDDLLELIYDGQNLGVLLDEQGQGMRDFDAQFAAAMEYENCYQLNAAVQIAQNLSNYVYVPEHKLHDYAVEELQERGLLEKVRNISEHFNYEEYAVNLLEQQGYRQTSDGLGFVIHFGELEETQSPGMTMQ